MDLKLKVSQGQHVCITEYAQDISLHSCRYAHGLSKEFLTNIVTTIDHTS